MLSGFNLPQKRATTPGLPKFTFAKIGHNCVLADLNKGKPSMLVINSTISQLFAGFDEKFSNSNKHNLLHISVY